jgi:hypothetical protein
MQYSRILLPFVCPLVLYSQWTFGVGPEDGEIGIGSLYADFDPENTAGEIDAGIHITPFPLISIRLGYLEYELDYDNALVPENSGSNTSGYYIAGGFHW